MLAREGGKIDVLPLPMILPVVDNGDCIIGLRVMEEAEVGIALPHGVVGVWD